VSERVDGAALKERWDAACAEGLEVLRRCRDLAEHRGEEYVARYLRGALDHLQSLHAMVNGHRMWPGRAAPGLVRDAPEDLWRPPYDEAGRTLDELTELFSSGLGAPGWDWSTGMPPGWRVTWRDRVRAFLPGVGG
jgi:hypothetical protein